MKRFCTKQVRIRIVTLHASFAHGDDSLVRRSCKLRDAVFVAKFLTSDDTLKSELLKVSRLLSLCCQNLLAAIISLRTPAYRLHKKCFCKEITSLWWYHIVRSKNFVLYINVKTHSSWAETVTRYSDRLDDWGSDVRFPDDARDLFLFHSALIGFVSHSVPINVY
jgi:hypothetical protein